MANEKPIDTLRDGWLKAAIWRNFGDNGSFYAVTLTRSYQDEAGNWQDSDSFSGSELLRIAHLMTQAYERINTLRQADRDELESGKAA